MLDHSLQLIQFPKALVERTPGGENLAKKKQGNVIPKRTLRVTTMPCKLRTKENVRIQCKNPTDSTVLDSLEMRIETVLAFYKLTHKPHNYMLRAFASTCRITRQPVLSGLGLVLSGLG